MSTTNPLDQTAHAQGSFATANSGTTATTVNATELIFAATGLPATTYTGTITAGSGYTILEKDTATPHAANESMLVTSKGSYAAAFSLSSTASWSAVVATFKQ